LPRARWLDLGTGLTPFWSPNGEWIYFDDTHGPFRCIWRQRFDPVAGKLITTGSMPDRGIAAIALSIPSSRKPRTSG